jgi:hypothetical protein
MKKEQENNGCKSNGQCVLPEMRSEGNVPKGDIDRRGEKELSVRSVQGGGSGEPDNSKKSSVKKAPAWVANKYERKKKFKCDVCRNSFVYFHKHEKRSRCRECERDLRAEFIECGLCSNKFSIRSLVPVKTIINPGARGSKTYVLYYCAGCEVRVRGRVRKTSESQKKQIKEATKRVGKRNK